MSMLKDLGCVLIIGLPGVVGFHFFLKLLDYLN